MNNKLFKSVSCRLITVALVILLISAKASSQELNYINERIQYELIIDESGLNKEDIYKYSKRWTANSFRDSKYVIRNDDETNGEIIGVGNANFRGIPKKKYLWSPDITVEFNFMINIKEGKARLRIYDVKRLILNSYSEDGFERELLEEVDSKNRRRKGRSLDNWLWTIKVTDEGFENLLDSYRMAIKDGALDDF